MPCTWESRNIRDDRSAEDSRSKVSHQCPAEGSRHKVRVDAVGVFDIRSAQSTKSMPRSESYTPHYRPLTLSSYTYAPHCFQCRFRGNKYPPKRFESMLR